MAAADDYPLGNTHGEVPRWRAMCDEIDLLRVKHRTLWDLGLAKDDLVRELTKHADALRESLNQAMDLLEGEGLGGRSIFGSAITAYDEFIKEA